MSLGLLQNLLPALLSKILTAWQALQWVSSCGWLGLACHANYTSYTYLESKDGF